MSRIVVLALLNDQHCCPKTEWLRKSCVFFLMVCVFLQLVVEQYRFYSGPILKSGEQVGRLLIEITRGDLTPLLIGGHCYHPMPKNGLTLAK